MALDWYDSRPFSLIGNPGVSLLTSLGMAYPLFYVFLPDYLATRGAQTGQSGPYYQWRNYMLSSVAGIFGPVAAGLMCNGKWLGRKYTMAIGALITMALFFAYTAVRTAAQNVGLSCAISFSLNIYYGTRKWPSGDPWKSSCRWNPA